MLAWLKQWGLFILGGVFTILGALFYLFRKPVVELEDNPAKKAAEAEAEKKAKEALDERDQQKKDAQDAHDTAEKKLIDEQKKDAKALEEDPDALNDFLKKTGKDVRGL